MDRRRGPGVAMAWVQTSGVGVPPSAPCLLLLVCISGLSVRRAFFLKFLFELEIEGGARVERGAREPRPRCRSPVLEMLSFSFFFFSLT